ncbi:MAG: hypothetical protein KGI25_02155 [Thaumarchaeota archaeon]|nr:hypothetical protein [Nitrososphaerota archaeon]
MNKTRLVFCSVAVISLLLMPSAVNPIAAAVQTGPVPILPSLLPPLDPNTSPLQPSIPDLGIVSLALPLPTLYSINQEKSGLVFSDPLNNEIETQQQLMADHGYWTYGGDAIAANAPYDFFKDMQGLHIGVQAITDGSWVGPYAVTQNETAKVFHAVITTPVRSIPDQYYENGLYVQTFEPGPINYVTCFSLTGSFGTEWAVVSVTGNVNEATNEQLLWVDTSLNQPLTRDCTIITNGNNYLKVYLDSVKVYESSSLNLQMSEPFQAYLEPQTSYAGALLNGVYANYYATSDESIKVTNNPVGASYVDIVVPNSSGSGTVVATAPVDSSGTATINVGQFDMPLAAYIKVYGAGGVELASTSSTVDIFGGNQYSASLLGTGIGLGGL